MPPTTRVWPLLLMITTACSDTIHVVDVDAAAPPEPTCVVACTTGTHCADGACLANECSPACAAGEVCAEHGASLCLCGDTPDCAGHCTNGQCITQCNDQLDNDDDGWTDLEDPDCLNNITESGTSAYRCNDGLDNDGDGLVDGADPQCDAAVHDEVLGQGPCADRCVYDETRDDGRERCQLWDDQQQKWIKLDEGHGRLHNRARRYISWLRRNNIPAGGLVDVDFETEALEIPAAYRAAGDSSEFTGHYLAAEALRFLATGSPDAEQQTRATLQAMHDAWNVSGDPGYLARFAVPSNFPDPVLLENVSPEDRRDHLFHPYKGEPWHWIGDVSRDMYSGVLLGYALAYDALTDEPTRELIRGDLLRFVEELMQVQTKTITLVWEGLRLPLELEMQYCVFNDDETDDGNPEIVIGSADVEDIRLWGVREFHPHLAQMLRQLPLLNWLPDFPRAGSAILLATAFSVALHVTAGVPAHATRHQAIQFHYDNHIDSWLEMAESRVYADKCGDGYYANNITFTSLYNLARLDISVPQRAQRIRATLLRDKVWQPVAHHQNIWFAFIYGANAPQGVNASQITTEHAQQLLLYPPAPRLRQIPDPTGVYPPSAQCPGRSAEVVRFDHRPAENYMWEKDPWRVLNNEDLTIQHSGVDFIEAYFMGRHHGFIDDDAPQTCLLWKKTP